MDSYTYDKELWAAKELREKIAYANSSEKDRLESLASSMAVRLSAEYGANDSDANYIINQYLR